MYRLPLINTGIHTYVSFILKPPSIGTLRFSLSLSQTPCGKQIVRTLFINSGCQKSIMQKNKDFLQEKSNRRKIRHAIEETWISPAVVNLKIPCAPPIEKVQYSKRGKELGAMLLPSNWTDPCRIEPGQLQGCGIPGQRAGSPIAVYICWSTMLRAQNRAGKGSTLLWRRYTFTIVLFLSMPPPPPFPFPSPHHLIVLYGTVGKVVKIPLSCTEKYWI